MKKLYTVVALFFALYNFGQEKELVGLLKQDNGPSFLLSLKYNADSLGAFTGITTLDPFGPYKTVTTVQGVVQDDALIFNELGNLETSIEDTSQLYCFIHTQNLKLIRNEDLIFYKGRYIGYDFNGNVCSEGEIQLSSKSSIKTNTVQKSIKSIAKSKKNQGTIPPILQEAKEVKQPKATTPVARKRKIIDSSKPILIHQDVENILWQSQSLKIHVKDNYIEDGDSIIIKFNTEISKIIQLSKGGETIDVPINEEKMKIRIYASSEGSSPPTTLDIMLIDQFSIYRSSIRLKKDQWIDIVLNTVE